ncbi:MAG: succinylglutamate desuccinylase/aspartoacylase family protein [Candidatus Brennerbacteria bacterium]
MNSVQARTLRLAFSELAKNSVAGVRGVWVVRSPVPGPIVGITLMTHGNEPSGLAAYHYFRHLYRLEEKLMRGTVYFVLNNIVAGKRYFSTRTVAAKRKARFVDINMNRLPSNTFLLKRDGRYEVRRAKELRKIWKQFQCALDIHSTGQPTKPMVIKLARSKSGMVSRFPIPTVISNIDAVQTGKPAAYFYGERRAETYSIETGGHELEPSRKRAIACVQSFLASQRLIDGPRTPRAQRQKEYRVFSSVWFPNTSYELTRRMRNFEKVGRGQIIARGDGKPILAPADAHVLMAPKGKKKPSINEEVMFLTRPSRPFRGK